MDYARTASLKMSTSQRTLNKEQNKNQLADLVKRIELTRAISMSRFQIFGEVRTSISACVVFGNMSPESDGFVAWSATRSNNFVSLHQLFMGKLEHESLIRVVTGITTKP